MKKKKKKVNGKFLSGTQGENCCKTPKGKSQMPQEVWDPWPLSQHLMSAGPQLGPYSLQIYRKALVASLHVSMLSKHPWDADSAGFSESAWVMPCSCWDEGMRTRLTALPG